MAASVRFLGLLVTLTLAWPIGKELLYTCELCYPVCKR